MAGRGILTWNPHSGRYMLAGANVKAQVLESSYITSLHVQPLTFIVSHNPHYFCRLSSCRSTVLYSLFPSFWLWYGVSSISISGGSSHLYHQALQNCPLSEIFIKPPRNGHGEHTSNGR